jgi:hypothetical protein
MWMSFLKHVSVINLDQSVDMYLILYGKLQVRKIQIEESKLMVVQEEVRIDKAGINVDAHQDVEVVE